MISQMYDLDDGRAWMPLCNPSPLLGKTTWNLRPTDNELSNMSSMLQDRQSNTIDRACLDLSFFSCKMWSSLRIAWMTSHAQHYGDTQPSMVSISETPNQTSHAKLWGSPVQRQGTECFKLATVGHMGHLGGWQKSDWIKASLQLYYPRHSHICLTAPTGFLWWGPWQAPPTFLLAFFGWDCLVLTKYFFLSPHVWER